MRLDNGAGYSYKVNVPKGDGGNPTTRGKFMAKFTDCTHLLISERKVKKGLKVLANLEFPGNISILMGILT